MSMHYTPGTPLHLMHQQTGWTETLRSCIMRTLTTNTQRPDTVASNLLSRKTIGLIVEASLRDAAEPSYAGLLLTQTRSKFLSKTHSGPATLRPQTVHCALHAQGGKVSVPPETLGCQQLQLSTDHTLRLEPKAFKSTLCLLPRNTQLLLSCVCSESDSSSTIILANLAYRLSQVTGQFKKPSMCHSLASSTSCMHACAQAELPQDFSTVSETRLLLTPSCPGCDSSTTQIPYVPLCPKLPHQGINASSAFNNKPTDTQTTPISRSEDAALCHSS